jgi:predicted HicB family RNase H-like nuclease
VVEVDRENDVLRFAQDLFEKNPDWITFYREVLGLSGIVRRRYRTPASLAEFEQTPAYTEIQEMLTRLRMQAIDPLTVDEATRVITVRLPKCLHDALKAEAHQHQTSMNKLCISKLLQIIDGNFVPSDVGR